MRLLNFQCRFEANTLFDIVIKGYAVSFETLMQRTGQTNRNDFRKARHSA